MVSVATTPKRKRKIVLGPKDHGRRMTLDEFDRATSVDERRYELSHGVIEVAEIPTLSHSQIIDMLRRAVYRYDTEHPGLVRFTAGGSEAKVMSQVHQSERHPDFMVYLHAALDQDQPWSEWVSEIVVEVVSGSSAKRDYEEKPPEYAAIGITEY